LFILGSCNNQQSTIDGEKTTAQGTPANSQQDRVLEADSLVLILPTLPDDTNKVKVYQRVIELYNRYGVPSKALPHITPGIDLAKKLNFRIVSLLEASGRTYWKLGQNDMALKYHSEALGLTDEKKQPKA
jgi:hypothetical protein